MPVQFSAGTWWEKPLTFFRSFSAKWKRIGLKNGVSGYVQLSQANLSTGGVTLQNRVSCIVLRSSKYIQTRKYIVGRFTRIRCSRTHDSVVARTGPSCTRKRIRDPHKRLFVTQKWEKTSTAPTSLRYQRWSSFGGPSFDWSPGDFWKGFTSSLKAFCKKALYRWDILATWWKRIDPITRAIQTYRRGSRGVDPPFLSKL